jgi:archaellum biogenesis ATPase FlaH
LEKLLLAACLKDRKSYELISEYIAPKRYSKEFNLLMERIGNYYAVDPEATHVDRDLIVVGITESVRAEKHQLRFTQMVDEAVATAVDLSEANVKHVVLTAKRQEVADELATALVNGAKHEQLLEEYNQLQGLTSLDDWLDRDMDVYQTDNLKEAIQQAFSTDGMLPVYPKSLADRLGGGLRGGHHMTIFARPEMGKTAEVITLACGFARAGFQGVYFTNEDRPGDIMMRMILCLTGLTKAQVLDNIDKAVELANAVGLDKITVVSAAPGTPAQIENIIKQYEPTWFVLDQLRNVAVKSDSRVNQLEAAATFSRNMAKKYNLVMVSVTQAGDSADGKAVLEMGDIDFSNTGIPAQADVLLGIGGTKEQVDEGIRVFSLCKNKITGDHSAFPTKLIPTISRYKDV